MIGRAWPSAAARLVAALLPLAASAVGAADYRFDASEIETKAFEWGGTLEAKQEGLRLRAASPLVALSLPGAAPRERLDRSTGTLELWARAHAGPVVADLRTRSVAAHDAQEDTTDSRVLEGGLRWTLSPQWTLDAGQRVQRWGKGYAWNPVGFIERPKDANDPQQAREGYTMLGAEWVRSFDGAWGGALSAASVTAVLVPTSGRVNAAYGASGHLNPALKLSALVHDTDVDLLWAGRGSRPARFGIDFSRNLGSQLEVHGEWARTRDLQRPLVPAAGASVAQRLDATSALLGLRVVTEREVTWIAELYRNGSGYTRDEFADFLQAAAGATPARAAQLAQTPYLRPNPGRDYAYLRVSAKEPFDWLYLTPAVTAIVNLRDHSHSLTPEMAYTGIDNLELRARWIVLRGAPDTEFGARPIRSRLEATARWSF